MPNLFKNLLSLNSTDTLGNATSNLFQELKSVQSWEPRPLAFGRSLSALLGDLDFAHSHSLIPHGNCHWDGRKFTVWPVSKSTSDLNYGGVYIYTRTINSIYYPVYVGQSENIGRRIEEHRQELIDSPTRFSEHVHCSSVSLGVLSRMLVEQNLISTHNPPLNIEHRTDSAPSEIARLVPDRWSQR